MTEPAAEAPVLYELRDPGVAVLTLNRPATLNAWNADIERAYYDLLDRCAADPAVKVIVVTGAGRGFCAGADMQVLQGIGSGSGADGGPRVGTLRQPNHTTTIPKPVIAALNGAAAGVGLVQALMCDMRFAARGAKLTAAFARRGLVAEWGSSWVLPRLVGMARAADVLMSSRVILAEEAVGMGLVNEVVEPEHLMDRVMEYAADMAANCAPTSLAAMKQQIWGHYDMTFQQAIDRSAVLMNTSLTKADFVEGVQSYLQKRPPAFSGLAADSWPLTV
jgi:enoyl-CoA hydratase/carnithine racemase